MILDLHENSEAEIISKCCQVLTQSGVIIIPTETVYGIICDATKNAAIDKIYDFKNRDFTKPLQVFTHSLSSAKSIAFFGINALNIASKHWPGALTIIVDKKPPSILANNFNRNNSTIGIRVPDSNFIQELLSSYENPLAATSANLSGEISATSADDVDLSLASKVDLFIKGEKSKIGVSSTVIDYTDDERPKIIRQGTVKIDT